MTHAQLTRGSQAETACPGEVEVAGGGFWSDVKWTVYECPTCRTRVNAVRPGHPWNHVARTPYNEDR